MDRRIRRNCISALACLLGMAGATWANTIYVHSGEADGHASLKSAVNAARSGDVIVVAEGQYSGPGNQDVEILGKAVTIRSRDPNDPAVVARTVIDCQGSQAMSHRAFSVGPGGGARLALEGLTIVNGVHPMSGGAVLCEGAELRLLNCAFSNGRVDWWGGAVCCRDSIARFEGCTFSNNISTSSRGGAVFCATSELELEDCSFEANRSAVESHDSSLTLTRCVFRKNTGSNGSAIHSRIDAGPQDRAGLHLNRCTFVANTAEASGGALYSFGVHPTLDGCTFTANTAGQDGGAILNYRANPVLTGCVFAGNQAAGLGGAMFSLFESNPQIVHCTFAANRANRGGAVAGKGAASSLISHSILWGNTADQGPSLYLARYDWGGALFASARVEFSDLAGGQAGVYREPGCEVAWAAGNINANPLFTLSARDEYRLSPGSPCIDAGDPCAVPASGAADLDGSPRRFGPAVDMGAYEFRGLAPVYRFWSPVLSRHFYTIDAAEKDKLIQQFSDVWTFEDVAYYAFSEPVDADLLPVYRFWSEALGKHLWTINEEQRLALTGTSASVWTFEGIAFYAYRESRRPLDAMPVYRFWSEQLGHHFYTIDEAEKDALVENYSRVWEFEGIVWYAYAGPHALDKAAYAFTAGAEGAAWTLTLAAMVEGQETQISAPNVELSPADARMQMTIDFHQHRLTLDKLSIQTRQISHAAEIPLPGTNTVIPLILTLQASFVLPTQRGPFDIDPATGVFADFVRANESRAGEDSTFVYRGSISLGGQATSFERTMPATPLELESFGTFQSLDLLPGGLGADVPSTFQWRRRQTGDLLAEGSFAGRRVQIYVVDSRVGTRGLWQGKLLETDQFAAASR